MKYAIIKMTILLCMGILRMQGCLSKPVDRSKLFSTLMALFSVDEMNYVKKHCSV